MNFKYLLPKLTAEQGEFWIYLSNKRKFQVILLFLLIISSGIVETFTLASVIPFLSLLTDSKSLIELPIINALLSITNFNQANQVLISAMSLFICLIVFSFVLRVSNQWFAGRVAARIGVDLNSKLFKKTLNKPYKYHLENNSSYTISKISDYVPKAVASIRLILDIYASIFLSIGLLIGLFSININIALLSIFIISTSFFCIAYLSKSILIKNSKIISQNINLQVKQIQENINSIKDIIMNNRQNYEVKKFRKLDIKMKFLQATNGFIAIFPKYFIETIGLLLLSGLTIFLSNNNTNEKDILPLLGIFALAAQRLLPYAQQIFSSWAAISSYKSEVSTILKMLSEKDEHKKIPKNISTLKIKKNISFQNVSFSYSNDTKKVLEGIDLTINKGEIIGIFGKTGSGKSTFVNLLIGLLSPSYGKILVDKININGDCNINFLYGWRKNISYVPQNIYLNDASVEANICSSDLNNNIDQKKLIKVSKIASIYDFINSTPRKFNTFVGEGGVRLSGGQKQRIGIARALYKESELLVLDEATSALDINTEKEIMESIKKNYTNKTIIIISHKTSTSKYCDKKLYVENKSIKFYD